MGAFEQTVVWVLGMSLVAWRITHLVVAEDGPFDILAKFRHFIGIRYDAHSVAYGKNVLAQVFTCIWCCSIWVGLALAFFVPHEPLNMGLFADICFHLYISLILSALTISINRLINGR